MPDRLSCLFLRKRLATMRRGSVRRPRETLVFCAHLPLRVRCSNLLIQTSASGFPYPMRLKNLIAPVLERAVSTNVMRTPSWCMRRSISW